MSFLSIEAAHRLKKSPLVRLNSVINWEALRYRMGNLGRSGLGPTGYDPLKLLKALVLQAWHSLSDEGLEEALRVRLDFLLITGLEQVPDATTICRFRNTLVEQGVLSKILRALNRQLEANGFKVCASKGAILDATLIQSAARPKKELEIVAQDRQEEDAPETICNVSLSKDPHATWLKKGKRSTFGYKGFMTVDTDDGFVEHVHVTPANVSEMTEFANIVPNLEPCHRLYTDKGSASKANRDLLRAFGIRNGIMEKAQKNKPLTRRQILFNRLISKVRWRVEQGFGTLKRRFCFSRASYLTTPKVQAQMTLKALAMNLLKALNMTLGRSTPKLRLN